MEGAPNNSPLRSKRILVKEDKSISPVTSESIGKRFLMLVPLLLVLALASYAYIKPKLGTYTASWFYPDASLASVPAEVSLSNPGVVEVVSVQQTEPNRALVTFRALKDGKTEATVAAGDVQRVFRLEVKDGGIWEGDINFSGWEAIQASLCVFLAALAALFASVLVQLWRASWYGYEMVASGGGFMFCLFQFLLFGGLLVFGSNPSFYHFLLDVRYMTSYFVLSSFFVVTPLVLLVSISNLSLIRHEGLRPVNLLGVATTIVWLLCFPLWYAIDTFFFASPVVSECFNAMVAISITFGVCLLLSTMLCAWLAARHVPDHGMDYLVVLGCGIRKDGTPSPLLAGRVDRAFDFDRERTAAGDAPAVFVPSGGQGPDEPISEAQSMGTYLISQRGVAPERIAYEDRSVNTRQNMAFSREVIERHAGRGVQDLRVGFSTTNYHVFRGYVCAHEAGMAVEGMGSKTKYYFWPNAFLREFVGLLAAEWKNILRLYLPVSVIYVAAVYILSVI